MSEVGFSEGIGANGGATPVGEITAGTMIRNAREAAGLHVAALAVSMKIPVKKLEALEADRLDLLHDAVFVRALAASVCRALKMDPAPVLGKLPLNATPKLNPDERGINAPFHVPSDVDGLAFPELMRKPSALIVLALVVAATTVFFLPDVTLPDWSNEIVSHPNKSADNSGPMPAMPPSTEVTEATTETVKVSQVVQSSLPSINEGVVVPPLTETPSIDSNAVKAPALVAPYPAISDPLIAASRPSSPVSGPAVAPSGVVTSTTLSSTGTVVFKAKGPTWVKVVDAKGIVQLSKTILDGDVVGASGTVPLSVVVGRVDVTDVEVRGKPFALAGVSRDNVARFEVK